MFPSLSFKNSFVSVFNSLTIIPDNNSSFSSLCPFSFWSNHAIPEIILVSSGFSGFVGSVGFVGSSGSTVFPVFVLLLVFDVLLEFVVFDGSVGSVGSSGSSGSVGSSGFSYSGCIICVTLDCANFT